MIMISQDLDQRTLSRLGRLQLATVKRNRALKNSCRSLFAWQLTVTSGGLVQFTPPRTRYVPVTLPIRHFYSMGSSHHHHCRLSLSRSYARCVLSVGTKLEVGFPGSWTPATGVGGRRPEGGGTSVGVSTWYQWRQRRAWLTYARRVYGTTLGSTCFLDLLLTMEQSYLLASWKH